MTDEKQVVSYEILAKALFEGYESIYAIDLETSEYRVYYESESYHKLELARRGDDFFESLLKTVSRVIAPKDRDYVLQKLSRDNLVAGVSKEKYYTILYRIQRDGREVHHQLRATLQPIDGKSYILMGVKDVDVLVKQRIAHEDELDSRRQKEGNYLEAVLATAIAYIDANLTTDAVLDSSVRAANGGKTHIPDMFPEGKPGKYSEFYSRFAKNYVCDNKRKYNTVGSREYLLGCYEKGDMRASVPFSIQVGDSPPQFCREVFYLYRERVTNDVHAFCVVYDLTAEQNRERELEKLKLELQLSRIRNSTSQMQPHFLYNALGSIQEVILSDPAYAADLLEDFTIHLRGCVRAMDDDRPVPFAQELDNIKAYVNIEKMRFGDKLDVQYDLRSMNFYVLPLSIQPLVENAIRHGIYQRGPQGGSVTVRTKESDDEWIVQITDNGVGFDAEELEEKLRLGEVDSTGLKNIRFRLEKLLGATLSVNSIEGVGTTVVVRIPRKVIDDEGDNSR